MSAPKSSAGWVGGIKSALARADVTNPSSNISTHPRATLDAQAARVVEARARVLQLDMERKRVDQVWDTTVADIERHYQEQLDSVKQQYNQKAAEIHAQYSEAFAALRREQKAMTEQLKAVDCKAEFVDHFKEPGDPPRVVEASDG